MNSTNGSRNPYRAKVRRAPKPAEPASDIVDMFRREDDRIKIWGRPYDGPVRNTKRPEGADADA